MPSLEEVYGLWREEEASMRAWLATLDDAALQANVTMRSGETPLWQVMAHLSFHGMQHRSEAAEALTMAGASPGNLDFIIYVAERK
jgi:uncharacterized damage-inducible protein DinB